MSRPALGAQGRAALALVHSAPEPAALLSTTRGEPTPPAAFPPLGIDADARRALALLHAETTIARLRLDLAAVESELAEALTENAHLQRQMDAAREEGERTARAAVARTLGGRVPSIFLVEE